MKSTAATPGGAPLPRHGDRITPVAYTPDIRRHRGGGARRWRALALSAAVCLLVVLGWHVLTARWVQIEVDPPPDRLAVRYTLIPLALNRGFLLRPGGEYDLFAEKAGYRPLEARIRVERNTERLRFALNKLPGTLRIETTGVSDARVLVDGEMHGLTPVVVTDLEAGGHDIRIEAERHLAFETRFEIEGMGKEQTLQVALEPNWAPVSIDALPAGATLWVDGERRAKVPATVELDGGTHELELRLTAHKTWLREVLVEPGAALDLGTVMLYPTDGLVQLSSQPPQAAVTLNGEYLGQTPLAVDIPLGADHRLLLARAGYRSRAESIRMERPEQRQLELVLEPVLGVVAFKAEPGDAELYIDGEPRGAANQRLSLPVVSHQVEIRRAGYRPYRGKVTPIEGYTQEVTARLRPISTSTAKAPATVPRAPAAPGTGGTAPDGTTLIRIVPGRFVSGASRREQGRRSNEVQREVVLTRPYYLAATEVTNEQFRRYAPGHRSGSFNGLSLEDERSPVVNVDWEQAAGYCNWLSRQQGLPEVYEQRGGRLVAKRPAPKGYRLPTEAEWAWAARFARQSQPQKFPWGDTMPPTSTTGNYADQSDAPYLANTLYDYNDGYAATAPPGSFAANPAGVFDMSGNVAEWVNDYYAIEHGAADTGPLRDPWGPDTGTHHVVRGSSWTSASISALRWTYRDYSKRPRPDLGFRVARYAD